MSRPAPWPGAQAFDEHLRESGLGAGVTRRMVIFARARWTEWGGWDVDAAELEEWLAARPGRKEYRYYLKRLFGYLSEAGIVETNPMLAVEAPPIGGPELPSPPESRLAEYETHLLEKGLAASTVKRHLGFARGRWADWGTWDVPPERLQEWLGSRSAPEERFYDLRRLYRWLVGAGAVQTNPMMALTLPGVNHRQDHAAELAPSGLDRYRAYLEARGFSKETVRGRLRFAKTQWLRWGTWDMSPAALAMFVWSHDNPWTRVTYFNELRALYRFLEREGDVAPNPTVDMQRPPMPRSRPTPLSKAEFDRALGAASGDLRAWLMLGYFAGLRRFEIAKFRGEDINETQIYVMGKGGRAWTIPTHPELWRLAQEYPRKGYWFTSPIRARVDQPITPVTVGNAIGNHFKELGIDGATHRTRHAYGTELIRAGAHIRLVQEMMRHESLATTAGYLGVDEEEKAAAVRLLGTGLSSLHTRPDLRLVNDG